MDLLNAVGGAGQMKDALADAFLQAGVGPGTPTLLIVTVDDAPSIDRARPRDLAAEKAQLTEVLDVLGSHGGCRVIFEDVADAAEIGGLVKRYWPLTGLHIMAHGDLDEGRDGLAATYDALPTTRLLRQLSWKGQLRCIFLSGCGTPWLADALASKLPLVVVATEPATVDLVAARLARRFYSALSRGAMLTQSYDAAVAEARVGLSGPADARQDGQDGQRALSWPWRMDYVPGRRIEEWQLLGWPMPLSTGAVDALRPTPRLVPRPLRRWLLYGGRGIPGLALSITGAGIGLLIGWASPFALALAGFLLVPGLVLISRRVRSGRRVIALLRNGRAVRGRVTSAPGGTFTIRYAAADGQLHTHTVRGDRTYAGRRIDVMLYDPARPDDAVSTDALWSLFMIDTDGAFVSPGYLFYLVTSIPAVRWWAAVELRGGRGGTPLALRPALARLLPAGRGGHTDRALSHRAESRPMTDRTPVILLVFANDRMSEHAGYLRDLVDERRGVSKALEKGASHQAYRLVIEPNVTHDALFDLLDTHRHDLVGVHFGGHADPDGLHFEDADGHPVVADMDAIAQALATLPSLRWVFLNGCGTEAHADTLLDGVRVPIVVTDRAIRDDVATAFACRFYRRLGDGASLDEGFEHARAATQAEQEDIGSSLRPTRLARPAGRATVEPGWPWVLRSPPDGAEALHWRLIADAFGGAVDTAPTPGPHRPMPAVARPAARTSAGASVADPPREVPAAVARSFKFGAWSMRGLQAWGAIGFCLAVLWITSTSGSSGPLIGLGVMLVLAAAFVGRQALQGRIIMRTLREGRVAFGQVIRTKTSPFPVNGRLSHTVELAFTDDEGTQREAIARVEQLGLVGSREQELLLYVPDSREVVLVDRIPGPVKFSPEGTLEPANRLVLWATLPAIGFAALMAVFLLIALI